MQRALCIQEDKQPNWKLGKIFGKTFHQRRYMGAVVHGVAKRPNWATELNWINTQKVFCISLGKCKLKSQWEVISHPLEWL